MPGHAAVVAVLIGTVTGQVAWGATKEAGRQLLHTHTHIYTHNTVSSFTYLYSSVCISCTCYCAQSGTYFGLRAVLGEMAGLVAVSTLDGLVSVVSVWHPLRRYPGTLVSVIDPSLKHTQLMHHLLIYCFVPTKEKGSTVNH